MIMDIQYIDFDSLERTPTDAILFQKGDKVKVSMLRQTPISNSYDLDIEVELPVMIVQDIVFKKDKTGQFLTKDGKKVLEGIKCIWFSKNLTLEQYIFNSKDLILV